MKFLKTLTKAEYADFKHFFDLAEDFDTAEEYIDNVKKGLSQIKPQWTREEVDDFVETYVANDPIVNEVLEHCKIKLSVLE